MITLEECGYKLEIDMGSRKLYKNDKFNWRIIVCADGRYKKIDNNGNAAYITKCEHEMINNLLIKPGFYNGGTE